MEQGRQTEEEEGGEWDRVAKSVERGSLRAEKREGGKGEERRARALHVAI